MLFSCELYIYIPYIYIYVYICIYIYVCIYTGREVERDGIRITLIKMNYFPNYKLEQKTGDKIERFSNIGEDK